MLSLPSDSFVGRAGGADVYTTANAGSPTNPSDWQWLSHHGFHVAAQSTDSSQFNRCDDQPWLTTGPQPGNLSASNVYVAFTYGLDCNPSSPAQARVATSSNNSAPPDFTQESSPGAYAGSGPANPGLRIAANPQTGTLYALWQKVSPSSTGPSPYINVTYYVNRSTDGGRSWGSPFVVATQATFQGSYARFGGVDALLGGVDALAVDPTTSSVYVVYGGLAASGAGNQLFLRQLKDTSGGSFNMGSPQAIPQATAAALPAVTVTSSGVVGVLYDNVDSIFQPTHRGPHTTMSAHFASSSDGGATFNDSVLKSFTFSQESCTVGRHCRAFGDFSQLKSLDGTFYGTFAAPRTAFTTTTQPNAIDPIFFSQ